jgi:hypothetical protein
MTAVTAAAATETDGGAGHDGDKEPTLKPAAPARLSPRIASVTDNGDWSAF